MLIVITVLMVFVSMIVWERRFYGVDIPVHEHVILLIKHLAAVLAVILSIVLAGYYFGLDKNVIFLLVGSLGAISWLYFDFYFSRNKIWDSEK